MPAPYSPPWGRGPSGRRSGPDPSMRVSNTERTEVADRLSKHYGDGRLDEEEFNKRLDQAMNAKTHADLNGLFADLPDLDEPRHAPPPAVAPIERARRPHPLPRFLFLVLVVLIAVSVGQALVRPFFGFPFWGFGLHIPWLLIALAVFLWWRFVRRR